VLVFRWASLAAGAMALTYVAAIVVRSSRSGHIRWEDISLHGLLLTVVAMLASLTLLAVFWGWSLRQLGIRVAGRQVAYVW